ncbi:MAG: AMP-binding protein [Lachnospiraceae bacterium]|nr:AMP-binding protein [Lachnospiraceae bacterium]
METLVGKILEYGDTQPEKKAVCFKNVTVTYGELKKRIIGMATLLHEMGIGKGHRVMLNAVSKPEYIAGLLSIQYIGAVTVGIDKFAKPENIQDIWEMTQADIFLADGKKLPEEIRTVSLKQLYKESVQEQEYIDYAEPEEGQLCELIFTTGTTGKPKGAMLSYRCIYANMLNTCNGIRMRGDDIVLNPLPLNHSFGMRVLRSTLYLGATIVLQSGFTFAKEIETNIGLHHCTAMVCVPASMEVIYRQMQEHFAPVIGQLRYIEFGAGSVSVDMKKKLLRLLPDTQLFNTWGSTETGGAVFLDITNHPDKLASIGRPLEGIEVKAVGLDGNEVAAKDMDTAGRMLLHGRMRMEGYWNEPVLTDETIRDDWLYTNDLIYIDEDGFVFMLGRADDIINVGGEKVSPIEVENIAQEYDEIKECACIGVDDPEGIVGQVPVLYVVVENGMADEGALLKYLANRMEKYKLPQEFIQVDELPRNKMQKLDRKALHRMYEERGSVDLMNPIICNLLARRSVREFTDQPIDNRILDMIIKTGYYAPSGHNMQTWRFTVLKSQDKIKELKEITRAKAEERKVHFYGFENPQILILVSNDRRNKDGIQDASCAAENMMLAAQSYGLGSVWLNPLMTLCDELEIRELLNSYQVPTQHIVWAAVALGYPKVPGKLLAKKENVVHFVES